MPKKKTKTKVVRPIASGTKSYSIKLNYNVERDIKAPKIKEQDIFETKKKK
tara:strand:+ start:362 stop:514 length:153 start_codon:yes stop_codon:yes gene_type:complete